MSHIRISSDNPMKTYIFPIQLILEIDGRWSVSCPSLPGCASWGRTQEDAVTNIREAVEAYVDDMLAAGDALPHENVRIIEEPAVSITI